MGADRIKGLFGIAALLLLLGAVVYLAGQDWGATLDPRVLDPRLAAEALLSSSDEPADPDDTKTRVFAVRSGDSAGSISERLQSAGLIKSALAFRLMAERLGVSGDLGVGEYELSPSMRPSEILDILSSGKTRAGPLVTIPEGWRSEEIAERLASKGIGTADEFMAIVRSGRIDSPALSGRPAGASLEGYLFPDSYRTDAKTTAESMVRRMVDQFELRFTAEMRQKAQARGMTVHQIVTLASIIEREAVIPSERPTMAAVFYNRLERSMKLDTDPTVQYAVASKGSVFRQGFGWWKADLTVQDLEIDSPYNTYKYPGLPPGPICNPGIASIMSALEPASSDYLYFVARPDGSHAFSTTLEEHLENVAKYQR